MFSAHGAPVMLPNASCCESGDHPTVSGTPATALASPFPPLTSWSLSGAASRNEPSRPETFVTSMRVPCSSRYTVASKRPSGEA